MLALFLFVIYFVGIMRTLHVLSHTNFFAASGTWGSLLPDKFLSARRISMMECGSFLNHLITVSPAPELKNQQGTSTLMENSKIKTAVCHNPNAKSIVSASTVASDTGAGTKAKRRAQRKTHGRPAILQAPTGGYNCTVM